MLVCALYWPIRELHHVLRLPRFRPLFCRSALYHLIIFALCFCTASSPHTVLDLYVVGVYKRQEARLMLLRYQMRALAHSSLSRITDESWAMDGFVSILWNFLKLVRSNWKLTLPIFCFYFVLLFLGGARYFSVNIDCY